MTRFTLPISLPDSSSEATVGVDLLRCGEVRAPAPWFYRAEAGGSWRRALGIGVPPEGFIRSPNGAFLVRHPSFGPFLIDAGLRSEAAVNLRRDFGMINGRFFSRLKMAAEEATAAQVRRHGVDPASIRLVVMTHLHVDHTSGMRDFPEATFLCTAAEMKATQDALAVLNGYVRRQLPTREHLQILDFATGAPYGPFSRTIDLFSDGSVRLVSTPGHTMGHMSVLVRLSGGDALLAGDAVYTLRSLRESLIPWRVADDDLFFSTLEQLRLWAQENPQAPLIPTHDASVWDEVQHLG